MKKICGKINPGDVMTKYLSWKEIEGMFYEMNVVGDF